MKMHPRVRRMVGLTGTPSSNGLMDWWAEFRLLDMGRRLGRFIIHYREAFFLPDHCSAQQVFPWKPKLGAEDEIYRRISDITISMKSADFLQMPAYISNCVPVKLSREERRTYEQLKRELVISLRGAQTDTMSAVSLPRKLCQLANGGIYDAEHNSLFFHERKLDALEDLPARTGGSATCPPSTCPKRERSSRARR